jgi:hypothetical protein
VLGALDVTGHPEGGFGDAREERRRGAVNVGGEVVGHEKKKRELRSEKKKNSWCR